MPSAAEYLPERRSLNTSTVKHFGTKVKVTKERGRPLDSPLAPVAAPR